MLSKSKKYTYMCVFIIHVVSFVQHSSAVGKRVTCRNEAGQEVDWFYMYKLPKHYTHSSRMGDTTGLRYLYITSRDYENWQLSDRKISDSDAMTALTLNPIFNDPTVMLLAFNDEYPNGTTLSNGGHIKGVVATDATTAIWLIHSVPKFPTIPKYEYPSTGEHYGQSILCLTLKASELHKVGHQLIYDEPHIYYARVPVPLSGKFPSLEEVLAGKWRHQAPFSNEVDVVTLAGNRFKTFAKSSRYNQELYEDFVAPVLDTNLLVESWRNGQGNLESNCSRSDKVFNIASIVGPQLNISFSATTDHSKWAVSKKTGLQLWRWRIGGKPNWICIGDINRQRHQLARGGGTVCQQNDQVAQLYQRLIGNFEPCKR